jgi:hypothetical protein
MHSKAQGLYSSNERLQVLGQLPRLSCASLIIRLAPISDGCWPQHCLGVCCYIPA